MSATRTDRRVQSVRRSGLRAIILFTLFLGLAIAAFAGPIPPAPEFPRGTVVETIHHVAVADPYRRLENGDDPAVRAWSDAQNARTRAYLDMLPGRTEVAAKLARMLRTASPYTSQLKARGVHIFGLRSDPTKQQPLLVVMPSSGDVSQARTIVDPNRLDPGGGIMIDWYAPSPDGSKVAVSLSKNGSEEGRLHLYETASGREIGEPIDRVHQPTGLGAAAWAANGRGFWYTLYPGEDAPPAERRFNVAVYFHELGTPVASDVRVLSAKEGVPRTGMIFLDDGAGAPATLASVQFGDGGRWQQYVLREGQPALRIAAYADRVIAGAVAKDGTIYGVSRKNAPMGKVLRLPAPYAGGFGAAKTIIAARPDAAIVDGGEFGAPLKVDGRRIYVTRISGGPIGTAVYSDRGRRIATLPAPPISSIDEVVPLPGGDVLYSVETFVDPPHFMRWSPNTGKAARTRIAMTSPVSYDDATVARVYARSKDGTRIPLNILAKKGVKLDGRNPTLLYAYGGFGANMSPSFSTGFRRMWLDAGGVYVIVNIRGGGEYGDDWHQQGMLGRKQNVFDDFAAAAETMIALGYTSRSKLAMRGVSNGGLLMGAIVTQHPGLARAVVGRVGVYDMLRLEQDENGAFNVGEFGSVKDPEQFKRLHDYSPAHHVVPGKVYPAVLLMTGANDGRVNPMHSRKFAALLQAAQAEPRHPILLRTSQTSGHGIGTSLDEQIDQDTDELMFLYDQLGMSVEQAAKE
ncbi:prolyl oligopeptidase family serine peptidase [Sphingosinicella rhizophila]|uniref:prolyl oligopeptidase n=1 Tax=Sphingosinicella rhizophila TaxID=3050082 RepID=A0ABU3Q6Z4_9SPHN|nr:prolyl oligopeptidase family serine peptidase [Sphingosinicella sp. GR2756]MDT9599178.1 prolyl oligopeptidase family serine peptidase [Sphingosinicella sp. GR2756]